MLIVLLVVGSTELYSGFAPHAASIEAALKYSAAIQVLRLTPSISLPFAKEIRPKAGIGAIGMTYGRRARLDAPAAAARPAAGLSKFRQRCQLERLHERQQFLLLRVTERFEPAPGIVGFAAMAMDCVAHRQ